MRWRCGLFKQAILFPLSLPVNINALGYSHMNTYSFQTSKMYLNCRISSNRLLVCQGENKNKRGFLACGLKKASSGCGFCWGQFPDHWLLVWSLNPTLTNHIFSDSVSKNIDNKRPWKASPFPVKLRWIWCNGMTTHKFNNEASQSRWVEVR